MDVGSGYDEGRECLSAAAEGPAAPTSQPRACSRLLVEVVGCDQGGRAHVAAQVAMLLSCWYMAGLLSDGDEYGAVTRWYDDDDVGWLPERWEQAPYMVYSYGFAALISSSTMSSSCVCGGGGQRAPHHLMLLGVCSMCKPAISPHPRKFVVVALMARSASQKLCEEVGRGEVG